MLLIPEGHGNMINMNIFIKQNTDKTTVLNEFQLYLYHLAKFHEMLLLTNNNVSVLI